MAIQGGVTLGDLSQYAGYLTVKELAKELSVHPDTIRRWERQKRIKCIRHPISNFRLFLLSDLLGEVGKHEHKRSNLRSRFVEGSGA